MCKIAFLFSGQGSQYSGMGKELYEYSVKAKEIFDLADAMRPGTSDQCFYATKEELSVTSNTQPCLFTMDLACAAALEEHGVKADCAAGFSLGELAAAAFCGVMTFETAFDLVCKRAELMQQCAQDHPGSMAAVLGLKEDQVRELCASYEDIYPVNYNCPGQTVVSGGEQMDAFIARVKKEKGKAIKLAVSGGFHSPFMKDAASALSQYMSHIKFALPRIPLYANVNALPYQDNAADLLSQQVMSPVLWQRTIENMQADEYSTFVELGAGKTLVGLLKKIGGAEAVYNVEDRDSLLQTVTALERDTDVAR